MSSPILNRVYSETYYDLLIDPDVYGEESGFGFTANAVLKSERTGTFTADAVIVSAIYAFTADAIKFRTIAGTFTANAVIKRERTATLTADAVIVSVVVSVTANAILLKTQSSTKTANAVIKRTNQPGSFTADALFISFKGTFTENAILRKTQSATRTANAVIKRTNQPGSFTADATFISFKGTFTGNAVLLKTQTATRTANAVIKRFDQPGSFTADSTFVSVIATFTANAIKLREISATRTANAVLKRLDQPGSFTADATFVSVVGSFTANAATTRSYTKSFTADATFLAHSFTISAYIVVPAPGEPGGPPLGTGIPAVIKVNGVDITSDVIIKTATFTQAVNARPGQFAFEVKDDEHIYNFVSGGRVTLDIDNRRAFDGYLDRATLRYAFPVDITTAPGETPRMWRLEGPDLNILFQKRMIFDQANPNADLPTYAAGTTDVFIIRDFMRHYVDLTGDDITYDGIVHVGSPNPDADGYIIPTGSSWGLAMSAIGQLPGAVWGLSQDRDLFYEDDSTENAPFRLSDTPDDSTSYGYREFSWTDDGTRLVNDAQVWGAGTGSPDPVYSETIDAPSVAEHGRWQLPGQFRGDMYRQATVDNAADSIVYGSPQNLHGGKDPYVLVECSVRQHGLRAGMKVRFQNEVYGLDKVLPVRRLSITFVNLYDVMYRLELTQEIDAPWFFAEFPGFRFPPFGKPPRTPRPPKWVIPEPVEGGCECGITDTFTRSDILGWGTSDMGVAWDWDDGNPDGMYLSAGYGVQYHPTTPINNSSDYVFAGLYTGETQTISVTHLIRFEQQDLDKGDGLKQWYAGGNGGTAGWTFSLNSSDTGGFASGFGVNLVRWDLIGDENAVEMALDTGVWYWVRFETTATYARVRFWPDGDAEPSTWDNELIYSSGSTAALDGYYLDSHITSGPVSALEIWYDDLDIEGVDTCSLVGYEPFARSIPVSTTGSFGAGPLGLWTRVPTSVNVPTLVGIESEAGVCRFQSGASPAPGRFTYQYLAAQAYTLPIDITIDCKRESVTNNGFHFLFVESPAIPGSDEMENWIEAELQQNLAGGVHISVQWNLGVEGDAAITPFPDPLKGFTTNQWQRYRFRIEETEMAYKAWIVGDAEPEDWDVILAFPEGTLDSILASSYFSLQLWSHSSGATYVDNLHLTHAGQDCSVDCGENNDVVVLDNFDDRTTGPGWGTASSGETTWLSGHSGGSSAVSGGIGLLTAPPTNGAVEFGAFVTPQEWPFVLYTRFRVNINATSLTVNGTNDQNVWQLSSGLGSSTEPEIIIYQGRFADLPRTRFLVFMSPNLYEVVIPTLTVNAWYDLKMYTSPGEFIRYKLWLATDPEPGWTVSTIVGPATSTVTGVVLEKYSPITGHAGTWTLETDFIEYQAGCSAVAQTPGTSPAPQMGAYGCQTATRLSSTVYELFLMPRSGTTEVYLDGRLMRLTYDYTEQTAARTITFLLPVDEADPVYVCYVAMAASEWIGDIN